MKALCYKLNNRMGMVLGTLMSVGCKLQAFGALLPCTLNCNMNKPSGTNLTWVNTGLVKQSFSLFLLLSFPVKYANTGDDLGFVTTRPSI